VAVYLIHFGGKLGNEKHSAQHYCGYTNGSVTDRVQRHIRGNGSAICRAASKRNLAFYIVRIWREGNRELEKKLKASHNLKRYCPLCNTNVSIMGREGRR